MSVATLPVILEVPDARLKTRAEPVVTIDDTLRRTMDGMLEAMYEAPGIGLAGPQIGLMRRVVVVDTAGQDEPRRPIRLINPEILWASSERAIAEEGCLSLPGYYGEVERAAAVRVGYTDETGQAREIEGDGLLARCLQHEIDHLDGILFIDHLSALKRGMILRKLAKARRAKRD
ncbi:peptide deformylase [Marinivivus vitaminiproducens]|uniref:peptide deformylase n=1 Tax=Marinivivus vitaminiproducens TaxID=3035935 RepID=UPI0027A9E62D|nr:peptide deformylase [Geminicoccaceae bacterium SCSIO 64248]